MKPRRALDSKGERKDRACLVLTMSLVSYAADSCALGSTPSDRIFFCLFNVRWPGANFSAQAPSGTIETLWSFSPEKRGARNGGIDIGEVRASASFFRVASHSETAHKPLTLHAVNEARIFRMSADFAWKSPCSQSRCSTRLSYAPTGSRRAPRQCGRDGRLIAGPRPIFQMGGDWVVGQFEK